MEMVRMVSRMSIPSIIFGFMTVLLAGFITEVSDPVVQLQIGEAALLFLNLFFYSLNSERISTLENRRKGR